MAQSIESYIDSHKTDVDKWLVALFGLYVSKCYETDKTAAQYVNSGRVCSDARRIHKVLEVLRHYNLIDDCRTAYGNRHYGYSSRYDKDSYDILVNREAFLKMAPQYAEPHEFDTTPPDKSTDRVKGYPTIDNLTYQGRLHLFFNPDVKEGNVEHFYNLIQLDGFNPLVIKEIRFTPKDVKKQIEILDSK